jgi:hypothetical protein
MSAVARRAQWSPRFRRLCGCCLSEHATLVTREAREARKFTADIEMGLPAAAGSAGAGSSNIEIEPAGAAAAAAASAAASTSAAAGASAIFAAAVNAADASSSTSSPSARTSSDDMAADAAATERLLALRAQLGATREVTSSQLEFKKVIGEGAFGTVYR